MDSNQKRNVIKLKQLLAEVDNIEYPPGWVMFGDNEHLPQMPDEVRKVLYAIYEELKKSGIGNPRALIKVMFTGEDGNRWWIYTNPKWSKIPVENRMALMYYDEEPDEEFTGWYMGEGGGLGGSGPLGKLNQKQLEYCIKNWRKLSIGR